MFFRKGYLAKATGARNLSSKTTSQALPAILRISSWLPAEKKIDPTKGVIERRIINPQDAKRMLALGKNVDPWGHVAAKVYIDGTASQDAKEVLKKSYFAYLKNNGLDDREDLLNTIDSVKFFDAYLSWYPNHKMGAFGSFTSDEINEWRDATHVKDPTVNAGKIRSEALLTRKYLAQNNGNFEKDVFQYGVPDSELSLSVGLDFQEIIKACFRLMEPKIEDETIVVKKASSDTFYYGMQMLKAMRIIEASRAKNSDQEIIDLLVESSFQDNFHVCTTAALALLEAGMGKEKYYTMVMQVLDSNPELAHGLPITHFTKKFAETLHNHPDFNSSAKPTSLRP